MSVYISFGWGTGGLFRWILKFDDLLLRFTVKKFLSFGVGQMKLHRCCHPGKPFGLP